MPSLEEIHPSHAMGEPETAIRSPRGTARFYSVRQCTRCWAEYGEHAAGKYLDDELKEPCPEV